MYNHIFLSVSEFDFICLFKICQDYSAGAYTSIKSCENSNNKINLHLILKAAKPKLMNEAIKLYSSADPTVHIEIVLLARVLGKHIQTVYL